MNNKFKACVFVPSVILSGLGSGIVQADTFTTSKANDSNRSRGLEEIVVTAQKRSQSLNDVPLSVSAVSGDQLSNLGISDVKDLAKAIPGFTYTESAFGTPVYTLRGIGFYDTSLGAKPTVSVYLDEAPLPFSILTRGATLDLERVEVLKGPQGTLFGQNATGGAINYIAAKPTDYFETGVDLSYARFDEAIIGGFVSGPISDTLKARFSIRSEQGGGFQKSYTRDDRLGDKDFTTARLLVDFEPTDSLRLGINLNGFIDKNEGQAAQLRGIVALGDPGRLGNLATYPIAPEDNQYADWTPGQDPQRDNSFYQGIFRAELDISNDMTITSITAYSDYDHDTDVDPDGVALRDYFYNTVGTIKSFSEELRLSGTLGNKTEFILGVNYSHERVFHQDNSGPYDDSTSAYQLTDIGFGPPFFVYDQFTKQTFENKAVFANVDYDLNDLITLHAGIRYTDSTIDFSGCTRDTDGTLANLFTNLLGAIRGGAGLDPITINQGECVTFPGTTLVPGVVVDKLSEDNVSWRLGIDLKPDEDTLVYASVSEGYKSGSYPTLSATDAYQFNPVTQESVLAYEVGLKATMFDQKMQFNAAIFYYDYSDKQLKGRVIATPDVFGPLEALVNIPESSAQGAEIQLDLAPIDGLRITLGATYLETEITDDFNNITSYGSARNFKGSEFPYAPEWQIAADAQYDWILTDSMGAFVGANLSYQSETKAVMGNPLDTPSDALSAAGGLSIDEYTLVDARAGLDMEGGKYRLTLFARNIFDEYYWTNATRITDTTVRYAGTPRTFGIGFNARF